MPIPGNRSHRIQAYWTQEQRLAGVIAGYWSAERGSGPKQRQHRNEGESHVVYATAGEAAEWLGISKPTLHRWVSQGKLSPLTGGKGKLRWFAKEEIVGYNKTSSRNDSVPAGSSTMAN